MFFSTPCRVLSSIVIAALSFNVAALDVEYCASESEGPCGGFSAGLTLTCVNVAGFGVRQVINLGQLNGHTVHVVASNDSTACAVSPAKPNIQILDPGTSSGVFTLSWPPDMVQAIGAVIVSTP